MLNDFLVELQQAQLQRVWGKHAGAVVKNDDPEQMGRIQVSCASVLGNGIVWARPCVPYAGPNIGFYFIPPVGAGVWVEFEAGDVSRPIWSGCYWAKGELPADAASADIKLIVTDAVNLKIDDQAAEAELSNSSDSKTTWAKEVVTEAGKSTQTIGASGVVSESASGKGKVDVSDSGVTVNNGAMAVM